MEKWSMYERLKEMEKDNARIGKYINFLEGGS